MKNIEEKTNISLSSDQISVVRKAIFISWLLGYAKKYPDQFPEKEGRVIYAVVGDSQTKIPALSKEEIISWNNKNRPDDLLTNDQFDSIKGIQKQCGGLVIVGKEYYTLLI